MTKFGSYLSSGPTPVAETCFQTAIQSTLGANDSSFYIASYTMPFAGHLMLNMWAEVNWPGTNTLPSGAALWFSPMTSTPVPGGYGDMGLAQDCAGIFSLAAQPRCHAIWVSLASGGGVNLYARFYTTVLNQVRVVSVGGFFQPMAL